MSATPVPAIDRAAINRANSQHSTGPRTESGKQRASLNAIRHGLNGASPVLPSEDPAAYEAHRRQFLDGSDELTLIRRLLSDRSPAREQLHAQLEPSSIVHPQYMDSSSPPRCQSFDPCTTKCEVLPPAILSRMK